MADLPRPWQHQLDVFKRQYLQLEDRLTYPDPDCLRNERFQELLYSALFSEDALKYSPPQGHELKTLKELMERIEESITDWEEEGISDDLMDKLASLLSSKQKSEAEAAQEKSYVSYTMSLLPPADDPPAITILEARRMLGGAGTTGFRTWEAALQFSQFLCSDCCPADLRPAGKTILELGAGTGFLSILCAKYLSAAQVYATDGFEDVVEDIGTNMFINELQDDPRISRRELRWGQALLGTEEAEFLGGAQVDLVLGADVTYAALPELVATIGDLFDLFPKLQVVIASTIRNDETYGNFLGLCSSASFEVDELDWVPDVPESQKGPFYSVEIPVKIVRITVKPGAKRPGAWSTT